MNVNNLKNILPATLNHGNICLPSLRSYESAKKILSKTNLIFCASVGREGSGFVGELFSNEPRCISFHESRPFSNGYRTIQNSMGSVYASNMVNRFKLRKIADSISRSSAETYIESNHMFIKTFGKELLYNMDLDFTLVSLRRPLSNSLKSFAELDWFGGVYSRASNWIYKINSFSPLNRDGLILESLLDEAIAYIISEKLNESLFLSSDKKKRITYEKFSVPPTKESVSRLKTKLRISGNLDNEVGKKNARSSDKLFTFSNDYCRQAILDFGMKNQLELKRREIEIDPNTHILRVRDEIWDL